ncbi:MAG: hypothetical protein JWO82_162 [Akkermansiaceae bacterium]|nr:hypothetical protein [Akkermansiaceae bacterium]
MKKALYLMPLALAALATAQTFTPARPPGGTPAAKKDVAVDISASAISGDFEIREGAPVPGLEKGDEIPAPPPGEASSDSGEAVPAELHPGEPEGVSVRVEPGKSGVAVASSKVKLLAPFPPKALAKAPAGWRLEHPENVPPLVKEVTLENGTRLNLSIRPHVLVPDADGSQVIGIGEPGYDPALQYAQAKTMGAILSSSLERMDKDSKDLGDALERLQQLLGSLPHPPPPAPPAPAVKTGNLSR